MSEPVTQDNWKITLAVWRALFLRESLARLFSTRSAWIWLLLEPMVHVAYLMIIFSAIRAHSVGGIDAGMWIMVGMLAFFMFRRTGNQVQKAISDNRGLFAYRQVKPIDTAIARAGLEGFLMIIISALIMLTTILYGRMSLPSDVWSFIVAFFGLWLLGLGFGLITSVLSELADEAGKLVKFIMRPLYFISGVAFPMALVPLPYREWLMLNPVAHGLEAARVAFAPLYHPAPELSLSYLYGFALIALFFSLALHRRFATFLASK